MGLRGYADRYRKDHQSHWLGWSELAFSHGGGSVHFNLQLKILDMDEKALGPLQKTVLKSVSSYIIYLRDFPTNHTVVFFLSALIVYAM